MQRLPGTQLTTIPKPFTLSVQPLSRQDVTAGSDLAVTNIWEFPTGLSEGGREASCIEQLAILCGQGARQQFREGRRRRGCGETRAREEV